MVVALFLLLCLYILYDYRKGSILIFILSPILDMFPFLWQSLGNVLIIIAVLIWFIRSRSKLNIIFHSIFTIGILITIISLFISNHFGAIKHTPSVIYLVIYYSSIYVLYEYISEDINLSDFAVNIIVYLSIVLVINGVVETLVHFNPLLELGRTLGLYSEDLPIITEIRYGIKRSQSVFDMHTTWGGYTIISFCTLLFLSKYKNYSNRYLLLLLVLLAANCFFTGARSAIVGLFFSLFAFIEAKDLRNRNVQIGIMVILLISPLFIDYFQDVFSSISDTEKVSGSNADMRENQFDICFYHFLKSPLYGNGISYTWEFALAFDKTLNGAESLWIPILIDQGILGCLAIISMYIVTAIYLIKSGNQKFIFVLLGFLIFNTMSSIPHYSIVNVIYYVIILSFFDNYEEYYSIQSEN